MINNNNVTSATEFAYGQTTYSWRVPRQVVTTLHETSKDECNRQGAEAHERRTTIVRAIRSLFGLTPYHYDNGDLDRICKHGGEVQVIPRSRSKWDIAHDAPVELDVRLNRL